MRKILTLALMTAAIQLTAAVATAQTAVLTNPAGAQTVTQPAGTILGVNNLNNVHYASQWCRTPGTLDETCVNNAIADIKAHGPVKAGGFPTGQVPIHWITTSAPTAPTGYFLANASYGLKIDAGTTGSTIYGNAFGAQTVSAYNVLDTTATFSPQIGITAPAGQAACIKSAGPPPVLGYCSSAITASGSCTCN